VFEKRGEKEMKKNFLPEAIKKLLSIVKEIEEQYPGKKFTLDGRLVGDIGEVLVSENYDVILYEKLAKKYDGYTSDKKLVQIKATFKDSLGFPCLEKNVPDYYIGIKINEDGTFEEIYNGPGINIYNLLSTRKETRNGLHSISIKTLREENKKIPIENKIPKKVVLI
jgi:hypothetical protein